MGDARNIQKVVDEANEMVHLPLDYRQQRTGPFLGAETLVVRFAQHVDRVSDRRSGFRSSCASIAKNSSLCRLAPVSAASARTKSSMSVQLPAHRTICPSASRRGSERTMNQR